MQLWYTCKENELNGPFTESELQKMIELDQLDANDWIRRDDEANWYSIASYNKTSESFDSLDAMPEPSPAHWVVLMWREGQYKQEGPYTNIAILEQIYQGRMEYGDFVWREGFDEWKRIGSVEEFIPKIKHEAKSEKKVESEVQKKSPENNQMNLFDSMLSHKMNENRYYQKMPEFSEEPTTEKPKPKKLSLDKKQEDLPSYYRPKKDKKKRWWFLSFFCLFLTLLIAFWGKSSLTLYL